MYEPGQEGALRVVGSEKQIAYVDHAREMGLSYMVSVTARSSDTVWPHLGPGLMTLMRDQNIRFITTEARGRPAYDMSELVTILVCHYHSVSRGLPLVRAVDKSTLAVTFNDVVRYTRYSNVDRVGEANGKDGRRLLFISEYTDCKYIMIS